MRRSIIVAACTVLAAMSCVSPMRASAAQLFALTSVQNGASSGARIFGSDGLTMGRIFESPSNIITFSSAESAQLPVSGPIFGFAVGLPLTSALPAQAPAVFEASSVNATSMPNLSSAQGLPGAQALGLQYGLPGGIQAMASLQSTTGGFANGALAAQGGVDPAVFAFYNFPQAPSRLGLGDAFGFGASQASALAAPVATAEVGHNLNAAALSSPLVSSLSARGPFWYNSYAPATRGQSVSLTIPFHVAKVPMKLHLGEQAVSDVETSSLATQILGPAFASSAVGKYNAVTGGVTLALPVLSRRATVSLDGWYETLHGDKSPFNLTPYAASAPGAAAMPGAVFTPAVPDISQYVGSASVALPLTSSLTVNATLSEQVSGGVALDALTQGLSQRTTAYGGGVAYKIPKTNSSIEFFSNKNIYTDDNVPTNSFTENRQNLYFSVKF